MSSRRILQNVLSKSIQMNSIRRFSALPIARANTNISKTAFVKATPAYTSLWKRAYNSKAEESNMFKVIDYEDIQKIIKKQADGYHLIDVREQKEVIQGAIPTAKNVPLSEFSNGVWTLSNEEFKDRFEFEKPSKDSTVILYCLAGVRSTRASEHLASLGYTDLRNYVGSWADYVEKSK